MGEHALVSELLPAYALGCLDAEEVARVAAHLAVCPACRAELRAYADVTGHLALAAPEFSPPPDLKRRVIAQAHASRSGVRPPQRHTVADLTQRALPVWGAVSLLLVVALAVSNFLLWQQLHQPKPQPAAMRTVALVGTGAAPDAVATIVVGVDGDQGALVVDDLPPLAEGRQYQLWLIKDGQRTSGGVFSVDQDGYGVLWVSPPRPLVEYTSFGVTIEPKGGSPAPTGERVLGGSL